VLPIALTRTLIERLVVRESVDVFGVQRSTRTAAFKLGFSARVTGELVLVASELATNILKYGKHGVLCLEQASSSEHGEGLLIEARDYGPPFRDFAVALLDRHDDKGPIQPDARRIAQGLGVGLGTVVRFTDCVEHVPLPDGKAVRALRFLDEAR
jgi:anti-sigma regulatory factor (Ser/Thr protein kinase)